MSFPSCPSCSFPDIPVADRAVEVATTCLVDDPGPTCGCPAMVTVHRSYRCAGCSETFWTAETVQATGAKAHSIRHLYPNPLR